MVRIQALLALAVWSSPLLVNGQTQAAAAYTPQFTTCPENFTRVRSVGTTNPSLSEGETNYISSRKSQVLPSAWKTYLSNLQGSGASLPSYVSGILGNGTDMPTLGIAASGGSNRAAIFGAGVLTTLDGRNSTYAKLGTGGLLQAATYLAGLSGGSWLVSSLIQADFPTFPELIFGPNSSDTSSSFGGWLTAYSLINPSTNATLNKAYVEVLLKEIAGKYEAGFDVTFSDFWARAVARHFVNGTNVANFWDVNETHGAGITFSSLVTVPSLTTYSAPFPIFVADLLSPAGNKSNILTAYGDYVPLSNPLFEFNIYEMGSFDPVLASFTPTQYLGTTNTSTCVVGYDQLSFVTGSSSSLFNAYNTSLPALLNSSIGPIFAALNSTYNETNVELDVARYPNPFYGVEGFIDFNQTFLNLVDGGEDGEVLPLQPLLVKSRGVDVIFAIDGMDDTADNWAEGASLIATQNRSSNFPSAYSFPPIPTNISEFAAQNLSTRPSFFGCSSPTSAPLVIYLANGGPPRDGSAPLTNTSLSQLAYSTSEVQGMLDQTYVFATQGYPASANTTVDPDWPACLACAIVDRARNRTGMERSGVCVDCFSRYCWNGSTEGLSVKSAAAAGRTVQGWSVMAAALAVVLALLL